MQPKWAMGHRGQRQSVPLRVRSLNTFYLEQPVIGCAVWGVFLQGTENENKWNLLHKFVFSLLLHSFLHLKHFL